MRKQQYNKQKQLTILYYIHKFHVTLLETFNTNMNSEAFQLYTYLTTLYHNLCVNVICVTTCQVI